MVHSSGEMLKKKTAVLKSEILTVKYCSSWSSKSICRQISLYYSVSVYAYLLWYFTSALNRWTLVSVYLNTHTGSLAKTTLICWAQLRITENRWHQTDSCCVTNRNNQLPTFPAGSELRVGRSEIWGGALRTQTIGRRHVTNLEASVGWLPEKGGAERVFFSSWLVCPLWAWVE